MNDLTGGVKQRLDEREHLFYSPLAAFSDQAVRRHPEQRQHTEYRQSYSLDADRILHSSAYTRYIDKTQVFSLIENDHLSHRVLHVQLVSRIARTIGRYLGLNEDLIEAVSLGHDIGHPPFGHDGERILSRLTHDYGCGYFHHNLQSIRFLEEIERGGRGWNLSLQTLDAILCHNGEVDLSRLKPSRHQTFDGLDRCMETMRREPSPDRIPMTLEGCVVRMADTIAYVGRDMEDALRLGLIRRKEIPRECADLLGTTNGTIVYTLVTDLIQASTGKPHTAFGPEVWQALKRLKRFNYERIYTHPAIKTHLDAVKGIYNYLYETCLTDLRQYRSSSGIIGKFLSGLSEEYRERHSHAEIVRDYLAGMTDSYFIAQAPEKMRPSPVRITGHVQ